MVPRSTRSDDVPASVTEASDRPSAAPYAAAGVVGGTGAVLLSTSSQHTAEPTPAKVMLGAGHSGCTVDDAVPDGMAYSSVAWPAGRLTPSDSGYSTVALVDDAPAAFVTITGRRG